MLALATVTLTAADVAIVTVPGATVCHAPTAACAYTPYDARAGHNDRSPPGDVHTSNDVIGSARVGAGVGAASGRLGI